MKAVIIAGGELAQPDFYGDWLSGAELVICADGGYRNAQKLGLEPDVVIGDFDSFPEENVSAGREKIVLPVEKDRTDTHECVCYALEQGYSEIVLLGAVGTRLDHTIANLHLLKIALDSGADMKIVNEHNEIFLVEKEAAIPRKDGWHVSFLPIGSAEGISSKGLYFPLENAHMEFGNPYGVSNEFTQDIAKVSVKSGLLLVILSRD